MRRLQLKGARQRGEFLVHTSNQSGSTNTRVLTFTTNSVNIGGIITWVTSVTLGDTFTVNRNGIYVMNGQHSYNVAGVMGISLNSTQLNTNISGITTADALCFTTSSATNLVAAFSTVARLKPGDVLRIHTDGNVDGVTQSASRFRIVRVGD